VTNVEILYFEDCANWQRAQAVVERVASELAVEIDVRLVEVADPDAAVAHRFLGSPTVRVDGKDVEPGAEARRGFAHSCRVYRTDRGFLREPPENWIRRALVGAAA
jgi:hypothetical protein